MNNYKFCYNCGKKIPKDATVCPYCHSPQTDSKNKSNVNKSQPNNTQTQNNQPKQPQRTQRQPNYNNQPQPQPQPRTNNMGQSINAQTGQANYNYNRPQPQPQPQMNNMNQPINNQGGQAIVNQRITPPPCSFGLAFKLYWENYVNFDGYSSRSEYWWWFLWSIILATGIGICTFGIGDIILGLACIIPSLSLLARRLRDAGLHNGGIITLEILNFVPFINFISGIICLIFCLMPSVRQEIH